MEDLFEKIKKIEELEKEIKKNKIESSIKELQDNIDKLENNEIKEKLNNLIKAGKYAFENNIIKSGYNTEDARKFIADGISHEIGFIDETENRFNAIGIYGGGACGDIGIRYQNNGFFATNQYGKNEIELKEDIAEYIYFQYDIKKVEQVNNWLKAFLNNIEDFIENFENRINEILKEKEKKVKEVF